MQYQIDDLSVDLSQRRITRAGALVALPDLSWRVFAALVENAPAAVSYADLARIAWRRDHVSADTLSQRIKLLRQALGDDPAAPRYVATERGVGYRLAATPSPISAENSRSRTPIKWIAAGGLILAMIAIIFVSTISQRPSPRAATSDQQSNAAAVSIDDRLERAGVYLARGSHDDNENALKLYRQVLEEEPENIRAMVGLSFALSHRSTKYDYGSETAFEAETLAQAAVDASPLNASAWHALGFAKDAQAQISEALRAYEQAIAIEPDSVSAVASAAYLLQVQGRFHEALLLEKQALDAGAPTLFSYLQIASALFHAGLDEDAQAWLSKAETLTPDNLLLKDIQAEYFLTKGDFDSAAEIAAPGSNMDRRAALDVRYGEAMLALNRNDEARAAFRAAMERDQNDATGAFELAALEFLLGEAHHAPSEHPLVLALQQNRTQGDEWPALSVHSASIFAGAGDGDGAVAALREAFALGYRNARRLGHSPFFTNLRDLPEFAALTAEMEREAAAQRALILNDARLAPFVTAASGAALPKPQKSP